MRMCFVCTECVCVFQRGKKVGRRNEDDQIITLPFKILNHGIYDNHIVIHLLKNKNMEA